MEPFNDFECRFKKKAFDASHCRYGNEFRF